MPCQTGDIDVMAIIDGDPLAVVEKLRARGHGVHITKGDLLDPLGDVITIDSEFPIQLIAAKYAWRSRQHREFWEGKGELTKCYPSPHTAINQFLFEAFRASMSLWRTGGWNGPGKARILETCVTLALPCPYN